MRIRSIAVIGAAVLALAACDSGDAELSTDSTIITGGTNAPAATTTTTPSDGGTAASTETTLVGERVSGYEVIQRTPNDNGESLIIVIPDGAYTDVDLENFIIELIESDPNVYGAEVFRDQAAAEAFMVDPAARTEEQNALIESDHFVTLVGRDRIEYNGPFAEFSGGAIGS